MKFNLPKCGGTQTELKGQKAHTNTHTVQCTHNRALTDSVSLHITGTGSYENNTNEKKEH